ncbi:helix-turn-helix domain-containing protein [Ramlibacter sp. MAHUQ-53]|uniref:helix-turn-helix domain-containing protein n=1 Tax=unclassified Ramlibacter TaxID=2617605 RepID=UPI003638A3B3
MTNLANALKSEITLVAHKALRDEAQQFKKATASYHREIAALQRRVEMLERLLERLRDEPAKALPPRAPRAPRPKALVEIDPSEAEAHPLRFSAKGFAKLRQRLGLSAAAMGALLGVTAQSVYKWEDGKARPRASQLQAIAAARKLGKREAAAKLAEMNHVDEPDEAPPVVTH